MFTGLFLFCYKLHLNQLEQITAKIQRFTAQLPLRRANELAKALNVSIDSQGIRLLPKQRLQELKILTMAEHGGQFPQ